MGERVQPELFTEQKTSDWRQVAIDKFQNRRKTVVTWVITPAYVLAALAAVGLALNDSSTLSWVGFFVSFVLLFAGHYAVKCTICNKTVFFGDEVAEMYDPKVCPRCGGKLKMSA